MTFTGWEVGKTYKLRCGDCAKLAHIFPDGELLIVVLNRHYRLFSNGRLDQYNISDIDLMPPRERHEFWLNVYKGHTTACHRTKTDADLYTNEEYRIGSAVHITLEQDESGNFQVVKE